MEQAEDSCLEELPAAGLVKEFIEEHGGVRELCEEPLVQLHCKPRHVWCLPRLQAPCVRMRHLSSRTCAHMHAPSHKGEIHFWPHGAHTDTCSSQLQP